MENNKRVIAVLGSGAFPTALALVLTLNGYRVVWYVHTDEYADTLQVNGYNPKYLSHVVFDTKMIEPTTNLTYALSQSEYVLVGIPSAHLLQTLTAVSQIEWRQKTIISAVKGVIGEKYMLLNDYLTNVMKFDAEKYVSLMGPCHAEVVAEQKKSYLTFSGLNETTTCFAATMFRNDFIRTTCNHDVWGAQFSALLKNIYAIGAGISAGLDYGDNFLSVYVTNCHREMQTFLNEHFDIAQPGIEKPDFFTSAYLGDLLVTCYSEHSRNRRYGYNIGKGLSPEVAGRKMHMLPEGYYGARAMSVIGEKHQIQTPIAAAIYDILYNEASPQEVFASIEKLLL